MPAWKKICALDDIPVLGSRRVTRTHLVPDAVDVALFRNTENEVFALLDRCPHKAGPLSQGIVFGKGVACPLHNWTISLEDGCAKAPDEGCTPRSQVQVLGGAVYLDEQELRNLAIDLSKPIAGPLRIKADA